MRIVDAHFHVWRQADLPWLSGPMQPRIFGPYEAIRRDYPIAEYRADLAGTAVEKSVYVQANWPVDRAVEEAAWIERLGQETGWPHATIAYADMTVADARPALDRLARLPRVRGIRQQFHWHQNPLYRFAAHADLCADAAVRRNIAHLADYAFSFDLQVFAGQMEGAAALADACPRVTFVLQHAGMLEDLSANGRDSWRACMATLAACPNVMAKLSGFGTFIHRNDPAHIAWIMRETVGLFGTNRCLWGSNYPIEKLWTGYAALLDAHLRASDAFDETARRALFFDNACRIYRL
jgi:predicted TIM-barrel fold metal-dependent hydrolase